MVPSLIERARAYVTKFPGAVTGSNGHGQTFAVATALAHGFALGEVDAWPLLAEYNQRCSPPWSERELRHKLASAMQSPSAKPHGYLLGTRGQSAPLRSPSQQAAKQPSISPAAAIEAFLKGARFKEADFITASPWRLPSPWHETKWQEHGVYLVDALFDPGERINFVCECKDWKKPADFTAMATAFFPDRRRRQKNQSAGSSFKPWPNRTCVSCSGRRWKAQALRSNPRPSPRALAYASFSVQRS